MITAQEAYQLVMQAKKNNGKTEQVDINRALGRVLAEPILADRAVPPFNRVAMDGIAFKLSSEITDGLSFNLQYTLNAGDVPSPLLGNNLCIEVMTGSSLPEGCDCVVPVELLEKDHDIISLKTNNLNPWQNIHRLGADCEKGQTIIQEKTRINALHLAILAGTGYSSVKVETQTKVVIISSGDELVEINETPLPHQIRKTNPYLLAGLLNDQRISLSRLHVADEKHSAKKSIKEALDANDVIITTGGVSMGKKDFLPEIFSELGVNQIFHKINQKPGKPMFFGTKNTKVIFGLPGNPVSVLVCVLKYVRPFLSIGATSQILSPADIDAFSKHRFLPVKLAENLNYDFIPNQGSGDYTSISSANGFVEVEADMAIRKGDVLSFIPV